jgi:nitrile hydratase accessory protein
VQSSPDQRVALMTDAAALPRRNGELVFQAPWEGRIFGVAVALSDRHVFSWDEFRDRLIAEIATADANQSAASYYERWLASLEKLLVDADCLTPSELDARTEEFRTGARDDD